MSAEQQEQVRGEEVWQEISPMVSPVEIETIKKTSSFLGVRTTLIRDPKSSIRYAVPVALSPNPTVDRILNYSKRTGYVGIMNVGMSGCLIAGSKVVLADGSIVNIESLGGKHLGHVRIDVAISETDSARIKKFFKYENEKTLEIITSNGKSIQGTYNHPLLVKRKNGKMEWVELGKLRIGDELQSIKEIKTTINKLIQTEFKKVFLKEGYHYNNDWKQGSHYKITRLGPRYKGKIPEQVDEELGSLMGYIIGDGFVRKNKEVAFVVAEGEDDLAPILETYFTNKFGLKPYISRNKLKDSKIAGRVIKRTKTVRTYGYYNIPVAKMLWFLGDKRIPDMIFKSPNNVLAKFLSWLFEADGHCFDIVHKKKRKTAINLTASTMELLRDVQLALLRFGIQSTIHKRNYERRSFSLNITRKESKIKFATSIGFQSIKKRKQLEEIILHMSKVKDRNIPYEEKVVEIIEHLKPMAVYDIEVPEKHRFITNGGIISHNSGKSTWTRWLIHQLHLRKQFNVHWRYRDDIKNLDKDIESLEKGLNHILIYDDASFVFDELKKEEVTHIAKRLTYIRHDVGGTVIIIMNIHYGTAIKKFFRNVPFKFLTSITMDEVFSLQDVYKYGKWKFLNFAKYYQQMMFHDKWTFEIDKWNRKLLPYKTDEPFRLGLALEGNYVHFFMYLKHSCATCDPEFDKKKVVNMDQIRAILEPKYGRDRTNTEIKRYGYHQHGIKTLNTVQLAIHRTLAQLDQANHIDWRKGIDEIIADQKRKRPRHYIKKGTIQQNVKEIESSTIGTDDLVQDRKEEIPHESETEYKEMTTELDQDINSLMEETKAAEVIQSTEDVPEKESQEEKSGPSDQSMDQNEMPYGFNDDSITGDFKQY